MDEEETLSLNENAAQLRMAKPVIRLLNRAAVDHAAKSRLSKAFHRHLPIVNWIRTYDRNTAVADLIAGFTLGLTMIPQSIAYASLANLPSQYGLYAAFMGSLIYVFVGTVKEVSIGPTSLMALLTVQYTFGKPVEFVIVLGFLAGCVELLMGIFKLGFIVDFISVPVTSAFTSATSLIIIGSQLKSLLGISYTAKDFFQSIVKLVTRFTELRAGDSILGMTCIIFLLSLRKLKDIKTNPDTIIGRCLGKAFWYLSISRNALIVMITSTMAFYWIRDINPSAFRLSGTVEPGMPDFQYPPFSIEYRNQTMGFIEVCRELGTGIVLVPLVAVLANVAIAKSFASGVIVDASQEMIALGLCNIFGACVKSMPTCGAFTRSAVSHASGVRTPMAGIYAGGMTLLALGLLTPYFYFIPRTTLAAVLICAVAFMIDLGLPKRLWLSNKRDFFSWLACFVVCMVFGVEVGLLFGIFINIVHLLFIWARPDIQVKLEDVDSMQYISVTPNLGLYYPGVDHLREKVGKAVLAAEFQVPVVIFCGKISGLDYSSAKGIANIAVDLHKNEQILILFNLEERLQKYIIVSDAEILFCPTMETLREILTQTNLRSGRIPLMPYIRSSIDLGYKIEPDIRVTAEQPNEDRL